MQQDSQAELEDERINLIESNQKFEDLLITNNLFVDYLNEFLLNPELGEKLRFNFVTGDLEIVDDDSNEMINSSIDWTSDFLNAQKSDDSRLPLRDLLGRNKPTGTSMTSTTSPSTPNHSRLSCTAEGVKRKLESQLKSIMKKQPTGSSACGTASPSNNNIARTKSTSLSALLVRDSTEPRRSKITDDESKANTRSNGTNSRLAQLLFDQVNKHSFKDIDLIKIEPRLQPADLKDPKAAAEAKIPVVSTRYTVNTLKKPFSLKWLRNRRLALFLQSELYNEFKLAMILAQLALFNNDLSKNTQKDLRIKYFKVELDEEMVTTSFNPYNAKNDLEKFKEHVKIDEANEEESESSGDLSNEENDDENEQPNSSAKKRRSARRKRPQTSSAPKLSQSNATQSKPPSARLIHNYTDVYKSIKLERLPTSLVISRQAGENNDPEPVKDEPPKVSENMDKMANMLVKSIIDNAIKQYNTQTSGDDCYDSDYIKKNFNYPSQQAIAAKMSRAALMKLNENDVYLNEFNQNKSNSRLSYYKDFNTDNDLLNSGRVNDGSGGGYDADIENNDDKFLLEFEDEPPELTDSQNFHHTYLRKVEIDNFKSFLKENDSLLFYKLWLDIEKLNTILDEKERTNYLRQLKLTYNQPHILNRLVNYSYNRNAFASKKNFYAYEYENADKQLWSYEHLTQTVQKKLLNSLVFYWWPKYCIRLNSFQDYMKRKYPSYYEQKTLLRTSRQLTYNRNNPGAANVTDLDAENIDKSIRQTAVAANGNDTIKMPLSNGKLIAAGDRSTGGKLLHNRKNQTQQRVRIDESNHFKKTSTGGSTGSERRIPTGLEGYELDEYKTSPPVGWKRPPSKATIVAKMIYDNDKPSTTSASKNPKKRNKYDKEIYFEAIYSEDLAGKIFMKYLINKSKIFAVNRLKCLQDLLKYKDMFYDENFNQEATRKYALEIYCKYIAVTGAETIDCSKTDRLKIHALFADSANANMVSFNSTSFRPTYEDTFDQIEEFLLVALYDEWKLFMETEENYFNHNEIENIERCISIKSKKIEELLDQGLIKLVPKSANLADVSYKSRHQSESHDKFGLSGVSSLMNNIKILDLNDLINHSRELEMFKEFLDSQNALNDLYCWMDIEAYTRLHPNELKLIEEQARMLKRKYLNKKYLFSANSPIDADTQNLILEKIGGWNVLLQDVPPNLLIILAKKYIEKKLKTHWLPMFYNSEFSVKSQFNNRTQMIDLVDDVLYLKNRLSPVKESLKIKKRRWLYSSQMIINFNKALKNSFTTKVFSKFLQLKTPKDEYDLDTSNNLVNDLQFLVEVQEYKELCQKKGENDKRIISKSKHIIDCFIRSRIPPQIRIDVPEEIASQILEQKDYFSPYIFLNAHLIVFNVLMPYWIEFDKMRSAKDLDLFDEFSTFKKSKENSKGPQSENAQDDGFEFEDKANKWKYNQYMKALKTQLVI